MLSWIFGWEASESAPRGRYGDGIRSERGRFAGRSDLIGSGGNKGTADWKLGDGDGGRFGSGVKVGLVARAIVARVSMVEFDRPWPDR